MLNKKKFCTISVLIFTDKIFSLQFTRGLQFQARTTLHEKHQDMKGGATTVNDHVI